MATRKQIREAIKTVIDPAFTRVYPGWRNSPDPRDFPCAMVFFDNGQPDRSFDGYDTEASLSIEIWASSADSIDDALDLLGTEAKNLIEEDETLNGLIDGISLSDFGYERDPESLAGALSLTFTVTYHDED